MPWTTIAIVFGSWIVLLTLTLIYYFGWGKRRSRDDGESA